MVQVAQKPAALTLGQKQQIFTLNVARFIVWCYNEGYRLTFGEAWRPVETAAAYSKQGKGISASLHISRLAVDMNLFIDGVYQAKTEAYKPLGDYWKTLHPLNAWGGDFKSRPDGNHFSMTHGGVR